MGSIKTESWTSEITQAELRGWLSRLNQPQRLDGPRARRLLAFHGRLPVRSTSLEVGRALCRVLEEKIRLLAPPPGASPEESLTYRVLDVCFIQGAKLFQAANELGMSQRQLTRERSRALAVLLAELEVVRGGAPESEALMPPAHQYVERPKEMNDLVEALDSSRNVVLYGAPGVGKSTLAASLVSSGRGGRRVFWHRFRPAINDTLEALLFELGEHAARVGSTELSDYVVGHLHGLDLTLGARLALKTFASEPSLLVFDDWAFAERHSPVIQFREEVIRRLPLLRTVTIAAEPNCVTGPGHPIYLGPFDRQETSCFMIRRGVPLEDELLDRVLSTTGGNAAMLERAAALLGGSSATDNH